MCRAAAPCIIHLLTVPGHPPQCGRTFTADYLHLTSRLILDQSLWIYFAVCQVVHLKLKLQAAGLVRNSVSAWIIYYEKLVHIYYVSCHKENKVAGNGFLLGPKKKIILPVFLFFFHLYWAFFCSRSMLTTYSPGTSLTGNTWHLSYVSDTT